MATKRDVLQEAARLGVVVVRVPAGRGIGRTNPTIELLAPAGKMFADDTHSLLCYDWPDAMQRLTGEPLTPCPEDCDCGGQGFDLSREDVERG